MTTNSQISNAVDADFLIIGAGVVGAALARELSGYTIGDQQVQVLMVDSRGDVCEGTSKANTAILHTGFDAKPGTLESKLVARGYHLTRAFCEETGIALERRGAILVAWDEDQRAALQTLQEKALANDYTKCQIISADEVYDAVPHLGPGALGGLVVPDESIIDAWSVPLGLAIDAVNRGATFRRYTKVTAITAGTDFTQVETLVGKGAPTSSTLRVRWVINCAGLGGDTIDAMMGYDRIHLHPRRGELLVFDKLSHQKTPQIVLPVPTALGKGVLVSPTIFGNCMVGPTAEDMEDRSDTATTEKGFAFLKEKGQKIMPTLLTEEVTAAYTGLRAASDLDDYLIDIDVDQRYVIVGGIRSTGLTSAMAIGEYVVEQLGEVGLNLQPRCSLPKPPAMPYLGNTDLRPALDPEKVKENPDYGCIVCFCERVSKAEIEQALTSVIPPAEISGLRRRTRAMNGRCQGFFCGAKVEHLATKAGLENAVQADEGTK